MRLHYLNRSDATGTFPVALHVFSCRKQTADAECVFRALPPQVLYDVHKILGSVDILGTPIKLGSSIIAGVASFFYEPAKGIVHSPEAFTRGLATGTVNLIKNSMYGVLDTVGHVTGGVSKGLAMLSLDDMYYQRFKARHRTSRVGNAGPVLEWTVQVRCLSWKDSGGCCSGHAALHQFCVMC